MTRQECEQKLIAAAEVAMEILREYNPTAATLDMHIGETGIISVDALNAGIGEGADFGNLPQTFAIYATEFPDGRIWHMEDHMRARGYLRDGQI